MGKRGFFQKNSKKGEIPFHRPPVYGIGWGKKRGLLGMNNRNIGFLGGGPDQLRLAGWFGEQTEWTVYAMLQIGRAHV